MKKNVFCLALVVSLFVFYACASAPSASVPASSSASSSSSAPTASTPAQQPQQTANAATTSPARAADLILTGAETYTVVWGDTLTKISRSKYQNGFYYPLIMLASGNVIWDQDYLRPGMRLTIPRLQANLNDPKARDSIKSYLLEIASLTERKRPRDAAGLRNLANSL